MVILVTEESSVQKFLDLFPAAIVIVTVGDENERAGMTASWNTQVSWDPPRIGIAIYHEWKTLELILKYKEFAVHLVSEDLLRIALSVFGGMSSRKVDKFKVIEEKYNIKVSKAKRIKAPIISEAPVILECKLSEHYVIGDHYLVVGDPIEAYGSLEKMPVVYFKGRAYKIGELAKCMTKD